MQIDPHTREYLLWTIRLAPDTATYDVSFDNFVTWHPLEVFGNMLRVLVAGPLAPPPTGTAVILAAGHNVAWVRASTSSQAIIRNGGEVYIEV